LTYELSAITNYATGDTSYFADMETPFDLTVYNVFDEDGQILFSTDMARQNLYVGTVTGVY
jgi:hypothetical protein